MNTPLDNAAIGRRLEELRHLRGLTRDQLAAKAVVHWPKITSHMLYHAETGRRQIKYAEALALATALGVELDAFDPGCARQCRGERRAPTHPHAAESARGLCRTHYWRLRNHGTVADDLPISRHTIPQIRCPACWLDIPNQTPVPYHADSTGITTCPASGQALTREKENA